jgi:hypothetical protein
MERGATVNLCFSSSFRVDIRENALRDQTKRIHNNNNNNNNNNVFYT